MCAEATARDTQSSVLSPQSSLILASASPRRRELLGRLGLPFEVAPSDVDEAIPAGAEPAGAAEALALYKARAVAAARPGRVVIGADTIVAIGGEILGKPRDDDEAV